MSGLNQDIANVPGQTAPQVRILPFPPALTDGVMVTQRTLTPLIQVRILVGQLTAGSSTDEHLSSKQMVVGSNPTRQTSAGSSVEERPDPTRKAVGSNPTPHASHLSSTAEQLICTQ